MGILNQGTNRLRDLHHDDIDTGILGSGDSVFVATDTDLESPVSGSEKTLTKTKTDKAITTEYILDSSSEVGTTFREYATYNGSNLAFNRFVFTGIEHTSADEIIVKNQWFYTEV